MTEWNLTITEAFLYHVMEKYHYNREDLVTLNQVGSRMMEAVEGSCGFLLLPFSDTACTPEADVVMTLGAGVDRLGEEYTAHGKYVEAYMTEVLAEELLLECYVKFNRWIADNTQYHVTGYRFYGEKDLKLEDMCHVLERIADSPVICNEAFFLAPGKSVVFRAKLTRDTNVSCEGICAGCSSRSCPNRMEPCQEDSG